MDLKNSLKTIKMNESKISAIVGGLIIIVIGIMVFNYFKNLRPGATTPESVTTENVETPLPLNSYTVQRGDTLWSIAEKELGNGFRWTEIKDANKLTNADQLAAGQVLVIPSEDDVEEPEVVVTSPSPSTVAQATIAPTSTPRATVTPIPTTVTTPETDTETEIAGASYTVVRGDNLWEIAERAYGDGFKWVDIAEANDLANPSIIHAGNVLTLPR